MVGHSIQDAQAALHDVFLNSDNPPVSTSSCVPSQDHLVTGTTPSSVALIGSEVTLTVCNLDVTVPRVVDMDDRSARNAITAAGLVVGRVGMVPDCTQFRGDVVSQDPQPGAQVLRGTAVDMTESTGKQANGKPCIVN